MLSGRYSGDDGVLAVELRLELPPPTPVAGPSPPAASFPPLRVSADLFRLDTGADAVYSASLRGAAPPPAGGRWETPVAGTGAAGGAVAGRLVLVEEAGAGTLTLDLGPDPDPAADPAAAAAPVLHCLLDRRGPGLRALRLTPWLSAGAEAPDADTLAPVEAPPEEPGAAARRVGFVSCFAAAGLEVELAPARPLDAAGAGADEAWTEAELETALGSLGPVPAPRPGEPWELPLLVVSRTEALSTLGMTFAAGGPLPGRRCAVFYDAVASHPKVRGRPQELARELLFTCVHEVGHLLGLPHAWQPLDLPGDPERHESALTFMTYPTLYRLGYGRFYRAFPFRFLAGELDHLHHAAWPRVSPAAAGEGEHDDAQLLALAAGGAPRQRHPGLELELRLPAPGPLAWAQPVQLEVRLANVSNRRIRVPRDVLSAEGGRLRLWIARGDRAPRSLRPLVERESRGPRVTLGVAGRNGGEPSYAIYSTVDLTFSADEFPFSEPGRYRVTAALTLPGGAAVASPPCELEVLPPTPGEEAAAGELLSEPVGRALVLGGDPEGLGLARLGRVVAEGRPPGLVPWAALRLGEARARRFRRLGATATAADPASAAALLRRALTGAALPNPVRFRTGGLRARCEVLAGRADSAERTLTSLRRFVEGTVESNRRLRRRLLGEVGALARRLRRLSREGL